MQSLLPEQLGSIVSGSKILWLSARWQHEEPGLIRLDCSLDARILIGDDHPRPESPCYFFKRKEITRYHSRRFDHC
jgi:hypothetical protein